MAHVTTINQLANGLVRSIADTSREDGSLRRMRDQAVKGLRNTSHARTNQFDVKSKLEGMIEKFSVLNRDDLAEALQTRLDELPSESKWMPEILSLLLELSDRPLEKTKIEDVQALAEASEVEQPQLSWAEIAAEDLLDEDNIWDDVERGYHSSEDEASEDGEGYSFVTTSTEATSVGEDDIAALARLHTVQPDESLLEELQTAHRRRDAQNQGSSISELALIREVIFMLHGSSSSIFLTAESNGHVSVNHSTALKTANESTISKLLAQFTHMGSSLNVLRRWIQSVQRLTYLQSCQASVQQLLMQSGRQLTAIEQRYLSPNKDTVVSIIDVWSEVETCSKPLLHLASIVESTEGRTQSSPFAFLDAIYDDVCIAEMSGDTLLFAVLVSVLFAGLRTYLKPVSTWVQTGILDPTDETFLVRDANPDCELGRLWYDRFAMRNLSNGGLSAPKFIHSFGSKVFAMGKSRAFLNALGEYCGTLESRYSSPDFASIEELLNSHQLLPLSQLLGDTLEIWIAQTGKDFTPTLRRMLLVEHRLLRTIDGLERVFCSQNGLVFQTFAETLFWRIDRDRRSWTNTFLLSELAQSTLGNGDYLETSSLSIGISEGYENGSSSSSMRKLDTVNLDYRFSWPVQNITCSSLPCSHSRAFAFLLQVYRAKYLLRPELFDLRLLDARTTRLPQNVVAALHLRQRLLTVVDVLQNHISSTCQVLSTSMRKDIQSADGIDSMAAVWAAHDRLFKTSLLLAHNLKPIREAITGQLELCEQFAGMWDRLVGRITPLTSSGNEQEDGDRGDEQFQEPSQKSALEIRRESDRSLSFIVAGVRSISRSNGDAALEALADRLDWSVH